MSVNTKITAIAPSLLAASCAREEDTKSSATSPSPVTPVSNLPSLTGASGGKEVDIEVEMQHPVRVGGMSPIDDKLVMFWQDNGYLLVDDVFNEQLINLVRDATIPLIDNESARARLWHNGHTTFPFPFAPPDPGTSIGTGIGSDPAVLVLNKVPLHARLNQVVMKLLGLGAEHYQVQLSRAEVCVQMTCQDQPLHLDIVNQSGSLMLPDNNNSSISRGPDALTALVYLDEGPICGGMYMYSLYIRHIQRNSSTAGGE
jgi:hypothetical protein